MRNLALSILLLFSTFANAANVIKYPDRAERLRIGGEVSVLYDIDESGKTGNVRLISESPQYVFNRSVSKQIYLWRYPEGSPQKDVPLKIIFKAN